MVTRLSLKKATDLWDGYWFTSEPPEKLICYRFVIFFLGGVYLFFLPQESGASFYANWVPISFYQLLPGPIDFDFIRNLRYLWVVLSILAGLNIFFSFTGKAASFLGLFYFGYGYNFGHVYHGTHLYVMIAIILSFSKIDKLRMSPHHRLPISFCFSYIVYVMTYCGWQKLYYGDGFRWFLSESFYLRMLQNPSSPALNQWIINSPLWVSQVAAFLGVILAEAFMPLFIFNKNSRYFLFILFLGFHVMVTLTFGGHHTFFSQIFCFSLLLPIDKFYVFFRRRTHKLESYCQELFL